MRMLVYGNSGSGKNTYAIALATCHAATHYDLDTIAWAPGQMTVPQPAANIAEALSNFMGANTDWIIEGCYGELVSAATAYCEELVFLNPGRNACIANNRKRPWEPHKYASIEAQNAMLENLQAWVASYYERADSS